MNCLQPVLSVKNLAIGYNNHIIASDINFNLSSGAVCALLGANGVGKSTLLKTIIGELSPLKGSITIFDKLLEEYSHKQIARLMAIVTTERILSGGLTVSELVAMGRHPYTGFLGRLTSKDKQIVTNSISIVGITHKKNCFLSELSDGERQKAMIAKALAQDTPIIVLDEPFSFLDVASRIEILSLLRELAKKGKIVLFSSHDVSQALRMATDILLFTTNRILISGKPEELIETKKIDYLFSDRSVVFSKEITDFLECNHHLK